MKNIKNKYLLTIMTLVAVFSFLAVPMTSSRVSAAAECGVATGLSIPQACPSFDCRNKSQQDCLKQNPITQWVVFGINLLGVLIVIGASAMIVFAGIEYIAAADNPERVKKAKQKITNVIIGIVAFFFLYAFLQWLIPGGAF
jgi:hypothetical protein